MHHISIHHKTTSHNNTSHSNALQTNISHNNTSRNKNIRQQYIRCKSHCNGCMKVEVVLQNAWALRWEAARARNTFFFGLSGCGDEGQFVCEAVVAGVALTRDWFLQGVHCAVVRVCSYRAFWNLWLQIAVQWLHDCCAVSLPCA